MGRSNKYALWLLSCINVLFPTLKDHSKSFCPTLRQLYGFQLPDPSKAGFCYIRLVDMGGRQAKPAFSNPSKMPQEETRVASAASPRWHSAFVNTTDVLANLECTVAMAKIHELLRWTTITNMNVVQDCQPNPDHPTHLQSWGFFLASSIFIFIFFSSYPHIRAHEHCKQKSHSSQKWLLQCWQEWREM